MLPEVRPTEITHRAVTNSRSHVQDRREASLRLYCTRHCTVPLDVQDRQDSTIWRNARRFAPLWVMRRILSYSACSEPRSHQSIETIVVFLTFSPTADRQVCVRAAGIRIPVFLHELLSNVGRKQLTCRCPVAKKTE